MNEAEFAYAAQNAFALINKAGKTINNQRRSDTVFLFG